MSIDRHRRRLESHIAGGRRDAALAILAQWRESDPGSIEPELLHARLDLATGRYREARDRVLASVRRLPCPARLARELSTSLKIFVAHDAFVEWATRYPHRKDIAAIDQALIASDLSAAGAYTMALDWIDEAIAKSPSDTICLVNRALICSYLGDPDRSRSDLHKVIGSAQDSAMAHWLLARLDRQLPESNHIERLRATIPLCMDIRDRAMLQFALFKELDDVGDFDPAWKALSEGCALMHRHQPYDRNAQERLFAAIRQAFPSPDGAVVHVSDAPVPLFIVGMHRSGTTLMERMLGSHPSVVDYGESQRLTAALRYAADHYCSQLIDEELIARIGAIDMAEVASGYLGEGRARTGEATHVTEKTPGNFQLIGFIRRALPQAKIIHMRRDPMDLCFANLREMLVEGARYSNSQEDLVHFHALYEGLMRHWHESHPGFVLDVDYEQLVAEPAVVSRRVFEFCGLEWSPQVIDTLGSAARPVSTLSSVQVRQPVNARSVGRYKPYAAWLQPLRQGLQVARTLP